MDFNEFITKLILSKETTNLSHIKIATNFIDQLEFAIEEEPEFLNNYTSFDNLSFAYNVYMMKLHEKHEIFRQDLFDNGKHVENMCILYETIWPVEDANHRTKQPLLITGVSEALQIYATHGILPSENLISVNLKVVNITKFLIENVKVQAFYDENIEVCPRIANSNLILIESVSQGTSRSISFCFNITRVKTTMIYFEITIESGELEDPMKIKTHPYHIQFLEFLVPNQMIKLHEMVFDRFWRNIPFHLLLQCKMKVGHEKCLESLQKNKFGIVPLYGKEGKSGKWTQINMLAYSWTEQVIAVMVIESGGEGKGEVNVTVEVRCSDTSIISYVREEKEAFVSIFSNGALEFLF